MADDRDRRRARRNEVHVPMVLLLGSDRYDVTTADISEAGASLSAPVAFPRGTMVVLEASCPRGCPMPIRLLARVVRGAEDTGTGHNGSSVGIAWLRAFAKGPVDHLVEFLAETLGVATDQPLNTERNPAGDCYFEFRPSSAGTQPPTQPCAAVEERSVLQRQRFLELQRGRFRVKAPVLYSINNVYHRGQLVALGEWGFAVVTQSAMPFPMAQVSLRYSPQIRGREGRFILYGETQLVLDARGPESGMFSVRITSLDELGRPGWFKLHLRDLGQETHVW